MTDHQAILEQAARWRGEGLRVAIATVVSTWGSAPRAAGSQLAVNERSEMAGSVSGGCVEVDVVHAALEAMKDGRPRLLEYGVTNERAWEVGLACGGSIRVYVERVE